MASPFGAPGINRSGSVTPAGYLSQPASVLERERVASMGEPEFCMQFFAAFEGVSVAAMSHSGAGPCSSQEEMR